MNYVKQDDYDSFKCIAGECPKSCCIGWQIVIDKDSLKKYKKEKGEFKSRLKEGIDYKEGAFRQGCGKRCSMLNKDNLCDMQLSMGEEALCYTCGMYPRHVEEYEGIREYSLSLSCPEAARMAVERIDRIGFTDSEDDEDEFYDDFDYMLYSKLVDAREVIYKIAQDRTVRIEKRMALILAFAGELQECLNGDKLFDMDDLIGSWNDYSSKKEQKFKPEDIKFLYSLETLEDDWHSILDTACEYLSKPGVMAGISDATKREEIALEQILVLLLYTYFCGAVYDDMIFSKACLCVYSVEWIFEIYRSRIDLNGLQTEAAKLNELIKSLYLYAREVEHSDLNLNAMEDYFDESFVGKDGD